MDKVNYMNKVPLTLDAVLGIDQKTVSTAFKENKAGFHKPITCV
jgi:hypothetical protein